MKLNHIKRYKQGRDTLFMIDFQVRGIRFRRRGYVSRDEALLIAAKARQELLLGTYKAEDYETIKQSGTIEEYFHNHYWESTRWTLKDSTRSVRLGIWKSSLLKYWGNKRMDTVTQRTLSVWYAVCAEKGNSAGYIAGQYHYLIHMLRHAHDNGFLLKLPETKAPRYKKIKQSFLNIIELNKVLKERPESIENKLVKVLFYQALRVGEACALTVSDLDFKAGTVRIDKRLYDGKIDTVKNNRVMDAPIHPECLSTFRDLVEQAAPHGALFSQVGRPRPSGKPRKRWGYMDRPQASRLINKLIKDALGDDTKFSGTHIFRRTMGSMLVDNGVPLEQVAAYLRDNEQTVLAHYSKVSKSKMKENIQGMKFLENDNLVSITPSLTVAGGAETLAKSND